VFENRVLRKIFGPKSNEVTGDWRKLHNEELLTCTFLQVMVNSRRTRLAGYVARIGEKRNAYRILVGESEKRDHWEEEDVVGWTIFK
jgi:hypothetical protein